ncbi:protein MARD1 [Cinnamomum micranthum f. kanehirae]|uniref:Protein MARD1 n=1 Tax=Cinnamomum micranthum f. kanehirae TaxID=337451 RepID=A0A3S3N7H0_9MAGN|nr:protein MARD1 [Cinnamomum micranthum f. kanehirae]
MLRKRSGSVSSNRGLMSDHTPLPSPTDKYRKPTSSFFSSPRLFTTFSAKCFSDSEAVMSPTSTLDSKPFSGIGSTFWSDKTPKSAKPTVDHRNHWEKIDSRGVGLGIVDALIDDNDKKFPKPDSRMVLFGSQLKIQIPPLPPSASSLGGSPGSPSDFGIKTRNSLSGPFSPALSPRPGLKTPSGSMNSGPEVRVFTGCLSAMWGFLVLGKNMAILAISPVIPWTIFSASVIHARKSLDRGKIFTCTEVRKHSAAANADSKRCCPMREGRRGHQIHLLPTMMIFLFLLGLVLDRFCSLK